MSCQKRVLATYDCTFVDGTNEGAVRVINTIYGVEPNGNIEKCTHNGRNDRTRR